MPIWKVFVVVLFGIVCLALTLATLIIPATVAEGTERWIWLAGLLAATLLMGTLFTMFLRSMDKSFGR